MITNPERQGRISGCLRAFGNWVNPGEALVHDVRTHLEDDVVPAITSQAVEEHAFWLADWLAAGWLAGCCLAVCLAGWLTGQLTG